MGAAEVLSVMREPHPRFGSARERFGYVVSLMVEARYERGVTCRELAEDWGMLVNTCEQYAAQASRHLELLGSREHVMQLVQSHAARWIAESGPDRVPASKLLLETVGGLVQKHEHRVEVSQRSDGELFAMVLSEIRADPVLREKAMRFLAAENPDVALLTTGEETE